MVVFFCMHRRPPKPTRIDTLFPYTTLFRAALAGYIDAWKNRGLAPDKVPANEAQGFANGRGIDLYRQYQERLKTLNAADFGDRLLDCLTIDRKSTRLNSSH